ncbi:MAG: glycosyltransferase [Bacteroidales bacterium]
MKIVHITTVHQRFDSRIFYKQCMSLQQEFNDVSLIVADGKGDEVRNSIKIIDVGLNSSRLKRLLFSSKRAIDKAISLKADIYHFHDPDLLFVAKKLCRYGKVIFDSHEDFPKLMLQRAYIPKLLRRFLFSIAANIERCIYKKLAGVVSATDDIQKKFLKYGDSNVITIKNYPMFGNSKVLSHKDDISHKFTACYVGGMTSVRGIKEMILACEMADVPLILAGPFDDEKFLQEMQSLSGWSNVEYLGVVPHNELKKMVYQRSNIGLNMLLSAPNHINAIPIKQLEYMAEGLPVVATKHIKFCVEITNQTNCGILVTPENIKECVEVITFLKNNMDKVLQMGKNGRKAIEYQYNWDKEKNKLIKFYNKIYNM